MGRDKGIAVCKDFWIHNLELDSHAMYKRVTFVDCRTGKRYTRNVTSRRVPFWRETGSKRICRYFRFMGIYYAVDDVLSTMGKDDQIKLFGIEGGVNGKY